MGKTREQALREKEQLVIVSLLKNVPENKYFTCECGHQLFKKKEFSTIYKCRLCGQLYKGGEDGIRKKKRKRA